MRIIGITSALLTLTASCDGEVTTPEPMPRDPATQVVGQPCAAACSAVGDRSQQCIAGRCELTDCEVGALGCGCHADGTCNAFYPVAVACSEQGLCEPTECTPGEHWCACGSGCAAGDRCVAGICRPPETQVTVSPEARACSFRVMGRGVDVQYGDGLRGRVHRRGEALGIAVASVQNREITGPALRLLPRDPSSPLSVGAAQCVNAAGRALGDPGVRVR